ncbi:MAG TPA: hypothetical protein VD886_16550 [Herpetosiphonaceae bacterium]|nr:hypothetical protein [Herpetosiphonaceae bacterium]
MNKQSDDFLHAYREEPEAGFAARLQGQLAGLGPPAESSPFMRLMPGRAGAQRRGAWLPRVAALAAVLALLFTVTPLRALATDILYKWGVMTFTNDPTIPELMAAGQTPTPVPDSGVGVTIELDGQQVYNIPKINQIVGYPVYIPQPTPAGATLYDRTAAEIGPGEHMAVAAYLMADGGMLTILQHRVNKRERERPVGQATVQPETIGANSGVWIEGLSTQNQGAKLLRTNMLIWDADGYTFTLMGGSLGRAEMKAIAESMAP